MHRREASQNDQSELKLNYAANLQYTSLTPHFVLF
jgi:hypothetical protein